MSVIAEFEVHHYQLLNGAPVGVRKCDFYFKVFSTAVVNISEGSRELINIAHRDTPRYR